MSAMLVIWIFMTILGLTAIGALVWAIQTGQFHSMNDGAETIFDLEEPVGTVTDSFPVSSRTDKGGVQ